MLKSRRFSQDFGGPEAALLAPEKCYIQAMENNLTNGSSLEATLDEAERFGAPAEKARHIHGLVEANRSSEFVRGFEIEFGPDSTDSPAVWVHLIVDPDLKPSKKKISELGEVVRKVRTALLQENLDLWPYVNVRGRP
jgi:hypothetical protein